MGDSRDVIEELLKLKDESHWEYLKAMEKGDEDDASYCKGKEMGFYEAIEIVDKIFNGCEDEE